MASLALREWLRRNRLSLVVGLLIVIAVAAAALFLQRPAPAPIVVQPAAARSSPSPVVVPIIVYVNGAVASPGLYHLPVGSRIDDALRAAGGATFDADLERLNLAARLADGQQLTVPKKVEVQATTGLGSPVTPARVNINTASVAELDGLAGVGPVTAQRIVAYREQHGPFTRIEQLREAKLVSAATFDKLKDLVTV